jgi:putative phage-type endonuclease
MALREHRLGASDMAAVMGLDPYRNALDVYMRLVGLGAPVVETPQMRRGNRMEAVIADWYEEEMRERFPRLVLAEAPSFIHPAHDWLLATPDRLIHLDPEQDLIAGRGLEVKTRAFTKKGEWGGAGTDEVPFGVAVQCAVGMAVCDLPEWDVAAALSLDDWRIYHLKRDAETEAAIIAAGQDFMCEHVAKRIPPPLDGSESAHRLLAALWPDAGTAMLPADEESESLLVSLQDIKGRIRDDEALESEVEVRLKEAIGENAGIVSALNGLKVTWTKNKTGAVSWAKVAKALNPPADLIAANTGEPPRVFRFTAKGA